MEVITLEKIVKLSTKIDEIKEVSLHDNIAYRYQSDGVVAFGYILIDGKFAANGEIEAFKSTIDVDLFAPIENLQRREDLKFSLLDFDYKVKDDILLFSIKLKIDGWKDSNNYYTPSDAPEFKDEPIIINMEIDPEKVLENIQKIQETEAEPEPEPEPKLEAGAEPEAEPEPESEAGAGAEPEAILEDKREQEIMETAIIAPLLSKEITGENSENHLVENGDFLNQQTVEKPILTLAVDPINLEEAELEVAKTSSEDLNEIIAIDEKEEKIIDVGQVEKNKKPIEKSLSLFADLFGRQKSSNVCWKFHSVAYGETYQSIAEKYQVKVEQLLLINENREIKEGKLICLP